VSQRRSGLHPNTGNSADSRVILEEAVDDYDPAFET
jgi:hypothetical protein